MNLRKSAAGRTATTAPWSRTELECFEDLTHEEDMVRECPAVYGMLNERGAAVAAHGGECDRDHQQRGGAHRIAMAVSALGVSVAVALVAGVVAEIVFVALHLRYELRMV